MSDKRILTSAVEDASTQRCLRALEEDNNNLRRLVEALDTRLTELEAIVEALP